ncbi:hypothetical protein DNTS_031048 [Danionella cerebrum]|uniref:snRNA-activating protein complex subunit 2 n=1 Tax=Danionella cerebrum TaxID=2873325 RepID=A0A553MYK9_9TELE|nr:hypothetical protein DNTS_031048 [Danionella translucida]TRY58281.1 hypothetical protein DNTS_031048 [Danionella translucida]
MKPPFRQRTEPARLYITTKSQGETIRSLHRGWNRKDLLVVLQTIKQQQQNGSSELELSEIRKKVPHHSPAEVERLINILKLRVLQKVNLQVQEQKKAEHKAKVPIEFWTELLQTVSRNHGRTISSAFSRIFIVAATEPLGLLNSEPPHYISVSDAFSRKYAVQTRKAPTISMVPVGPKDKAKAKRIAPKSTSQEPKVAETPADAPPQQPGSGATSSPASSNENNPDSMDQHRPMMMKCVVNFGKIYQYLADMESKTCNAALSPMECAVLLEMLLCLPEEIPLLKCKELQHHLLQTYSKLSQPLGKTAKRMFTKKASTAAESAGKVPVTESAEVQKSWAGTGICPLNPLLLPVALLQRKSPDSGK